MENTVISRVDQPKVLSAFRHRRFRRRLFLAWLAAHLMSLAHAVGSSRRGERRRSHC